jgi:hypothetical protein
MNNEFFWIEVISVEVEVNDYSVPFYPQEYEDDKDDFEEWELY